ncbi:isoflavone 3'-hydroxylase-like [Chenopodium quinoa]|uniref:isoflavone 3'-hydroxylase-like n=1 Tax=Chenopodium quinoa TaxID=63459 RepID=UPI000B77102A|nr:isoflavone 3'-hydroxylase-like [Chenopodium quinoa]
MDENLLFYAAIFLVSYILTKKILHKFQKHPPTPFPTIPILGHLYLLKNPAQIHRTLVKVSDRYGPVVQLWLGFRRTLLVSSASAAEDCLYHNDIIFANRPRLIAAKIIGYDYTTILWAPYGPLWRNHRRIAATEILSPHRLHLLSDIRTEEVRSLVKGINDHEAEGRDCTLEIKPALLELTNNIMMRMIAGKRMYGEAVETEEGKRFKMLFKELLAIGGAFSAGDFFPFFKYLGLNKAAEKRCKAVFVKLDKFLQDLVDEQRGKLMEEEDHVGKNSKKKNLIQVLLGLQSTDPSYFTDDIIKGLVLILLLTGTETSSSAIEWAVALLLKHPECYNKAKKEIHEYVGRDRLIEEQDIQHLPYLHCIINETLRMYPVTPILPPHESSEDCVVGGYHIPKGTMLTLNLWAIQNDPKVWDEPSKFKPERFENVEGDRVGYQFMPFGSGRRSCPGENMATRVVGFTLGSLIQCFEWESSEEEVDFEEKVAVSMLKVKPLQAKFKPHNEMLELISQI